MKINWDILDIQVKISTLIISKVNVLYRAKVLAPLFFGANCDVFLFDDCIIESVQKKHSIPNSFQHKIKCDWKKNMSKRKQHMK